MTQGGSRGSTHHVEEGAYMHFRSFYVDKDEDVEEREGYDEFWRETNAIKDEGASSFGSFWIC